MKAITLSDNSKGFFVRLEMIVTMSRFAQALCEHFYRKNQSFRNIKKTEAMKILKDELKWHGRAGEYEGESIGTDNIDEYNQIYSDAHEWVAKNYPNLKP